MHGKEKGGKKSKWKNKEATCFALKRNGKKESLKQEKRLPVFFFFLGKKRRRYPIDSFIDRLAALSAAMND